MFNTPSQTGQFMVEAQMQGVDGVQAAQPVLLPAYFQYGADQRIEVDGVAGCKLVQGQQPVTIGKKENDHFQLTWGGPPDWRVTVIVDSDDLWCFGQQARSRLYHSFALFLTQLEHLESLELLRANATAELRRHITISLPLSFEETLRWQYGLDGHGRHVDLAPGMQLEVHTSNFSYFAPHQQQNGFAPVGSMTFELSRSVQDGTPYLSTNRFLSRFQAISANHPDGVISSLLDLEARGLRRRYFRLFYPSQWADGNAPTWLYSENIALLGANSLTDLTKGTQQFKTASEQLNSLADEQSCMWYRFRSPTRLIPKITIFLNGQRHRVPLGTSVADLLATFSDEPLSAADGNTFSIWRRGNLGPYAVYGGSMMLPVMSGQEEAAATAPLAIGHLPLLKGDRISWDSE